MQQLLGASITGMDGTLLCKLFLQHLPANVHMVLASSEETKSLEEIAQLADKIVIAAPPSIAAVEKSQLSNNR